MGVIFDILGSFIIRMAIVVIILNLMITLQEGLYKNTERLSLNELIFAPAQTMAADIKLAGYRASKTFVRAQRNDMSFYADTDNNGVSETIRYYIDSSISTNKRLFRTVNGASQLLIASNVTYYNFVYFNVTGVSVTGNNITTVKSVYVELGLESKKSLTSYWGGKTDKVTTTNRWSQHFFPPNL